VSSEAIHRDVDALGFGETRRRVIEVNHGAWLGRVVRPCGQHWR
jgi:hypothetical protein